MSGESDDLAFSANFNRDFLDTKNPKSMKFAFSSIKLKRPKMFFSFSILTLSLSLFCQMNFAQQVQLSLADILIGLRSKKATLPEKNKLLTDAVKERGITFAVTPEIELELQTTGADTDLVKAIKEKALKVKAETVSAPPVQDFAFFKRRADESILNGEYDSAVGDYNRAIELNPKDALAYLNRGRAYYNKTSYDLAIVDFTKAIEINPKSLPAYLNRGEAFEKKDDLQKALGDYQKAVELDANNESAKNNLRRLQLEQAKAEQLKNEQLKIEQAKAEQAKIEQARIEQAKIEQAKNQPVNNAPKPKTTEKTVIAPPTNAVAAAPNADASKPVELGQLNALAVKLAMPAYPEMARKMMMQGKVTVQVALDEEGKVVSAKAVNGQSLLRSAAEDAALKSKFKPTTVGEKAVKATGFVVYNFVAQK